MALVTQCEKSAALVAGVVLLLTAGTPDVGTRAWCGAMNEKPRGEWTANEAGDYARHCLPGR